MTFVKICGLKTLEHLRAASEADAVGFVVASPKSPRDLPFPEAARLAREAGPFQTTVLVTAERDPAVLERAVREVRPHALQVPWRAGQGAFASLKLSFPTLRILVACRPEDAHLVAEGTPDALVLDAATADGYGGTGTPTDWHRARAVRDASTLPVVLAGGLTAANVADAIRAVSPYGVDVSSGVETDGAKDPEKIRAFIRAAKEAAP